MSQKQDGKRRRKDSEGESPLEVNQDVIKKNFSSGINKLVELFQGFKEDFNEFKNYFKDLREEVKIIKEKNSENSENLLNTILNTSNKMMEKFDAMTKSPAILVGATEKEEIERKILGWRNNLNKRKMEYRNYLRNNETANIYSKWQRQEPPVIPKKFQPKPFVREKDQQTQIRLLLATDQMKSEMNIMKIKTEDYERQFKTTDLQMISDILQNSTRLQEIAKEEWKRQCNVEEERSKTLWLEKKKNGTKNKSMNIFRIKKQSIKHNEKYRGPEDLLEIPQTSENMGKTDTQTEI